MYTGPPPQSHAFMHTRSQQSKPTQSTYDETRVCNDQGPTSTLTTRVSTVICVHGPGATHIPHGHASDDSLRALSDICSPHMACIRASAYDKTAAPSAHYEIPCRHTSPQTTRKVHLSLYCAWWGPYSSLGGLA